MSRKSPNILPMVVRFELMKMVQEEYVNSKMTDQEFSVVATERLSRTINKDQVRYAREQFGIDAHMTRLPSGMASRVDKLEHELAVLTQRVNIYLGVAK